MPPKEPRWWYEGPDGGGPMARLLQPAARIYSHFSARRMSREARHVSPLPVICAGNFTAGGTGKTPLALHIARELIDMGERPAFLTRGYRGTLAGPAWIESGHMNAGETGDEPLLLAVLAPVMIARDREAGARAIALSAQGCSAIVMDDGLQNPSLYKDLRIALVDGARGVGNGEVIPAGPLRAPLDVQLGHVDCVVVNRGSDSPGEETRVEMQLRRRFKGPVLAAHVEPDAETAWLQGARVLAYSGIANPARFFDLAERLGASLVGRRAFADHHAFSDRDARALLSEAETTGAVLLTTEKDYVRLSGAEGVLGELAHASRTLPIRLVFDARNRERLRALIEGALKTARARVPRSP